MFFKLANMFMRGAAFLGAEGDKTDIDIANGANTIKDTVKAVVDTILLPILGIVGAAGIIWAIVLGINMARADSTEKREEAKKRLIGLVIGIVVLIVLVIFFSVGFVPMLEAFGIGKTTGTV